MASCSAESSISDAIEQMTQFDNDDTDAAQVDLVDIGQAGSSFGTGLEE